MKNQKEDRRSQRTRQMIGAALADLMQTKHYDAITVQDIIDRANIGRSTFYAHYLDKEDLLTSQFERLISELHPPQVTSMAQVTQVSLGMFRHTQEHYHLYKSLMWGKGNELVFKTLQDLISRQIEQGLATHLKGDTPSVPPAVIATFLTGGFLTLVRWWLDNNLPYPPEEINRMFEQMVMPSIKALLKDAE